MFDANSFSPEPTASARALAGLSVLPLAILLDTETLLVLGLADGTPPASASAAFVVANHRIDGRWQALSWPDRSGHGGDAFVAVLSADHAAHLHAIPFELRDDSGTPAVMMPGIERLELDAGPLVDWLGRHGGEVSGVFDFIRSALAPAGMSARCEAYLVALLTDISEHDGFIEIIAEPECGGVLLQGWAMHLPAATLALILQNGTLVEEVVVAAHFHRSDLLPSARGFVAYLRCARSFNTADHCRLFFRLGNRYHRLDVVDKRVGLEPEHVVGHLLDMMGRLEGSADSIRALKRVCRPRFRGNETVSSLAVPVRIACDLALHVPGAGLFLSGWLLDPKRLVRLLVVKSTGSAYCRIEERLVRMARPDVCAGFRGDPLFAGCLQPWDTQHGFMAFVPCATPLNRGEVYYLELVLDDESCAFLPIHFHEGDGEAVLQQILAAVDLDDPDFNRLVGEHLVPLFNGLAAAAAAKPAVPASVVTLGPHGSDRPSADVSVIVPLGDAWDDFDINLAHFAGDDDFAQAELIVVAARHAADHIAARLQRAARFYQLRGRLVLTATRLDRLEALILGATAASAERLLLLSPAVLPIERGWLGRLLSEAAALGDGAALCPTLLYEDHSIRFAGREMPGTTAAAADGLTGYAAASIAATTTRPVWVGVLDCCCLDRSLFTAVGGSEGPYVSQQLGSLDFALRLRAAGGRFHWAPMISLYALDDDGRGEEAHWQRVRRLVEEHSFETRWGATLAAAGDRQGCPR